MSAPQLIRENLIAAVARAESARNKSGRAAAFAAAAAYGDALVCLKGDDAIDFDPGIANTLPTTKNAAYHDAAKKFLGAAWKELGFEVTS